MGVPVIAITRIKSIEENAVCEAIVIQPNEDEETIIADGLFIIQKFPSSALLKNLASN